MDETKKPILFFRWFRFFAVLTVLLAAMRLCDMISMPWLWVFSPLWFWAALYLISIILLAVSIAVFSFLNLP